MKLLYLCVFAAVATTAYSDLKDVDRILAKIDFEAVRSSGRLLQNMFNCFIDGVKCTPDAFELKKFFPEMLSTCCAECSENLLAETKRMADFLYANKPEYGKKTLEKYDPEGKYLAKCGEILKSKGIDLTRF
ncbi:ejaculatory bulb-specific protein 3-like [Coccinella septempunctata]|uniref:ejaculatory bulb-specific protein 3-like n=1 Tax=Coccinella septempunctata TaxID=41139 RepID=UPI001D080EB4|nr:ejaculatory bulb-specific protein 3-like [Coccinella septempunctata]